MRCSPPLAEAPAAGIKRTAGSDRRNGREWLGCGQQQQPQIQQQVSDLGCGDELSMLYIAEATIDDGQSLTNHIGGSRLGHGDHPTQITPFPCASRPVHEPFTPAGDGRACRSSGAFGP